uniref:Prokineticin domain-containing protein n=1 Tax=Oncorhynchus kisutch TaxID=8019 RepID=A0A8C7FBE5_ONCKI
ACEKDSHLWIRSPRICHITYSFTYCMCFCLCFQVPFFGKRLHHTCPCLPNLACITTSEGKSKCLSLYMYQEYYL